MSLERLGYSDWFEQSSRAKKPEGFELARVIAVHKESYVLTNGEWSTRGEVTGKLMFSAASPMDFPTVGDWCYVQFFGTDSPAIIHEVLPRRSILKRKTAGKKIEYQAIAANIDIAFVVQSLDSDFSVRRFERYFVMIREGNIEPVILLSKQDLVTDAELAERIGEIEEALPDARILAFSSERNTGLDKIEDLLLSGRTFCLLGSSGVGKTTLLNRLLGEELFSTQAVREKDSKGRHTTTNRQLISLRTGSMIIDTPGMRELGNIGVDAGLESVFDEFTELESRCKFSDCLHVQESGCAILEAVESGEIASERFESFHKLKNESAHYEMSYQEKRKKDKKLGKFYKTVQRYKYKNR